MICKGCGLKGCYWSRTSGKPRLIEPSGERHICPSYRAKKPKYAGPMTKQGETITGSSFHPTCLGCPGLPWDECCGKSMASAIDRANREADERFQRMLDYAST